MTMVALRKKPRWPENSELRNRGRTIYSLRIRSKVINMVYPLLLRGLSGDYTMQEIGDYFGIHYSRVSKIVRAEARVRRKAKGKT